VFTTRQIAETSSPTDRIAALNYISIVRKITITPEITLMLHNSQATYNGDNEDEMT
jgi:hypothetical protein